MFHPLIKQPFWEIGHVSQTATTDGDKSLFQFTGKVYEALIGLQQNLHRWYDPETGRWISVDPTSFDGGDVNLYRYVANMSLNSFDSNGLDRRLLCSIYHFYVEVDTYDSDGNVTGMAELHFSLRGRETYEDGLADPEAKILFSRKSTRFEDEFMLKAWKTKAVIFNSLPGHGYTGFDNCLTEALYWYMYPRSIFVLY